MKIENTATKFFQSKEHYLQFRKAWSDAVHSPNAKKVTCSVYGSRSPGWLQSYHHLMYALLRGRDGTLGFALKSEAIEKIYPVLHSSLPDVPATYHGFDEALTNLRFNCGIISGSTPTSDMYKQIVTDRLLKPFAGTVTVEMIAALYEEICHA